MYSLLLDRCHWNAVVFVCLYCFCHVVIFVRTSYAGMNHTCVVMGSYGFYISRNWNSACNNGVGIEMRLETTGGTGYLAVGMHPHLKHYLSAVSAVRRLPSAVRTATPAFGVQSSGLFCSRPGGLELVTRLPAISIVFRLQFLAGPENFSFLILLEYTAH